MADRLLRELAIGLVNERGDDADAVRTKDDLKSYKCNSALKKRIHASSIGLVDLDRGLADLQLVRIVDSSTACTHTVD